MEGYTRNPRSHYRPAPQPPSSTAGTGYYKKGFGNGAAVVSGGNGFTAYDDVFGGPPKFGATPFAPRAEDYSEIFGSFRSSRSSSIPMLDLPPVDDSVAAFEVVGCSGIEYSDIFGGFDFGDFAASYDELFRRSDGSEESSDDAWTPVGTESPSGESLYASSGRNKYFLDGDFHGTVEDKVFDFSYNNVNLGTTENLEHFYEPQPSSFPVYTYEVEGSDVRKEGEERYSSAVADDIILCEDSSGNISVQAPRKTESPHLPPVSELPPTITDRKKNPASSTSDCEQSKTNTIETIFGGGSFDFIDVELSAGSSSIASAEAIKEAMERAKVKINTAQELRKRKKDCEKDTLFTNSDGKVILLYDEPISRADELHLKVNRESNGVKTSANSLQFSSNASEVFSDPLRFHDAVNKAAEPAQRNVVTEGTSEWKVTTECFELVNNDNSNAEINQLDSIKKPVQKLEQEVVGNDVYIRENEGSESADEARSPRDSRRRLRGNKTASRNAFHEKMVKLALDVHETVKVSGHVETTKSRKEGVEATQNPEMHHARRFDRAADQVYYDRNQNEDFYLAGSELSSEEDFVQVDIDEKGKEACSFNENERRGTKEETQKWVEEFVEREDNGRGLTDAHQDDEKELCVRKGAENDVKLKKAHKESNGRENIVCENGAHKTDECEENAAVSDCYRKKLKESLEDTMNAADKDDVDAYEEEMEEPVETNEFENSHMDECWAINEEQKTKSEVDLQYELKTADQDSSQDRNVQIESENSISAGPSTPDEAVPETVHENQELKSSKLSTSPDFTSTSEERLENHVVEYIPTNKEKSDSRSADLNGKADTIEANQPLMSERKETKAVNGDAAAEDKETAKKLKRKEESDKERLRELPLEKERELEAQRVRKLEEEREKEREKLRLRRLEELREEEREKDLEKERLRKLEEEWEREREREKDRMGVELKMSAERVTIETRQRAMAEARERLEKACAEAREKSVGKTFKDASQLRAERAAVERATAEARERAMEKAMADRANFKVERSVSEKFSSSFRSVELRNCSSSSDLWNSDKNGVEGESSQRCRARLERHRRTVDRVAKALAEKNMRDLIAQREQAERNRFAETLDADIKRWSNGKEGNLRALLSTLQYILGADSGWQSIPLTEVITSAAVKKAYRKATLCVHPDKLQQRGATIQQKYICEKVFDLLKDAWNRFNSEER